MMGFVAPFQAPALGDKDGVPTNSLLRVPACVSARPESSELVPGGPQVLTRQTCVQSEQSGMGAHGDGASQ